MPVVAALEFDSTGRTAEEAEGRTLLSDVAAATQPESLLAVDRKLAAMCRERGPLRAVLAQIACRLVVLRAWERIGYRCLSDYAAERLGLSARWVRSLALVGEGFRKFPALEQALASGVLGWTKVRLLASLPTDEDAAEWIARAQRLTSEQLAKQVRAVDLGAIEAGALEEPERSRVFEVRCSPDVRLKWYAARGVASRAAGRMLPVAEAAEFIAAEVLSAFPVEAEGAEDAFDEAAASSSVADEGSEEPPATRGSVTPPRSQAYGTLASFLIGLEGADEFELDDRLRRALALEQRLDARLGPLLARVWGRFAHRALGYRTREAYARERLGMDPTRARALVRLERGAVGSEPFAAAYRSGALSWVKAGLLAPLVSADPLGRFMKDWVAWAQQVTVRRLREDVDWALTLEDADRDAFHRTGGLPPEARGQSAADREIGARDRDPEEDMSSARSAPTETCTASFIGPADVVQLFRAVLCTVRRRIEKADGRLPTEGEALGAMLDYVFACGGAGKVPAQHRIFERDGWQCTVPGCTSMQNLHEHHMQFRSAGGGDEPPNLTSLCAFHHLRGVHANRIRCTGRAPDGLTWQLGIRAGAPPWVTYRSGDIQV